MITKTFLKTTALVGFTTVLISCGGSQDKKTPVSMDNEQDKLSYSFGVDIGKNIQKSEIENINVDALAQAISDVLEGKELLLTETESRKTIQDYFQKKQQEKEADKASQYEAVKKAGEEFLAKNKEREGVIVTESGLQYEVIVEGNGKKPSGPTSRVKVHYHGTTPEGEVFDSSVERGEPIEFGLNQVIKGWTEGVQLMSEGAKYKFYIPQELAYGANPRPGGPIQPYMPLVFEVELIEVIGE